MGQAPETGLIPWQIPRNPRNLQHKRLMLLLLLTVGSDPPDQHFGQRRDSALPVMYVVNAGVRGNEEPGTGDRVLRSPAFTVDSPSTT